MTYHRMTIDLIITPTLLKKEIYTIFGKSLRLPMENQIPQDFGKSQGNDSGGKEAKERERRRSGDSPSLTDSSLQGKSCTPRWS